MCGAGQSPVVLGGDQQVDGDALALVVEEVLVRLVLCPGPGAGRSVGQQVGLLPAEQCRAEEKHSLCVRRLRRAQQGQQRGDQDDGPGVVGHRPAQPGVEAVHETQQRRGLAPVRLEAGRRARRAPTGYGRAAGQRVYGHGHPGPGILSSATMHRRALVRETKDRPVPRTKA